MYTDTRTNDKRTISTHKQLRAHQTFFFWFVLGLLAPVEQKIRVNPQGKKIPKRTIIFKPILKYKPLDRPTASHLKVQVERAGGSVQQEVDHRVGQPGFLEC